MSKQKTWTAKAADLKSDWYVVDATDQVLGRLASGVAAILRGKHKPTFTPHLNSGDHVVVINAAKIKVTGSKLQTKEDTRYTGYPAGLPRPSCARDGGSRAAACDRHPAQVRRDDQGHRRRVERAGGRDRPRHRPSPDALRPRLSTRPEKGGPADPRRADEGAQEVRPEAGSES